MTSRFSSVRFATWEHVEHVGLVRKRGTRVGTRVFFDVGNNHGWVWAHTPAPAGVAPAPAASSSCINSGYFKQSYLEIASVDFKYFDEVKAIDLSFHLVKKYLQST